MGDQRLSSLSIMSLVKDNLKMDDIIDRFALRKERRLNLIYKK